MCRNDRDTSCIPPPSHTKKPLGLLSLMGHPQAASLWSWETLKSACKTNCGPDLGLWLGLCYNQDVPYAQAVKMQTSELLSSKWSDVIWSEREKAWKYFCQILYFYIQWFLATVSWWRQFVLIDAIRLNVKFSINLHSASLLFQHLQSFFNNQFIT